MIVMTTEVGAVYKYPIRSQVSDGLGSHAQEHESRCHVQLAGLQSIPLEQRIVPMRTAQGGGERGRSDLLLPDSHPEVKRNNLRLRGLALRNRAVYNLCDKLLAQTFSRGLAVGWLWPSWCWLLSLLANSVG